MPTTVAGRFSRPGLLIWIFQLEKLRLRESESWSCEDRGWQGWNLSTGIPVQVEDSSPPGSKTVPSEFPTAPDARPGLSVPDTQCSNPLASSSENSLQASCPFRGCIWVYLTMGAASCHPFPSPRAGLSLILPATPFPATDPGLGSGRQG